MHKDLVEKRKVKNPCRKTEASVFIILRFIFKNKYGVTFDRASVINCNSNRLLGTPSKED
jgi:hypothetical protein